LRKDYLAEKDEKLNREYIENYFDFLKIIKKEKIDKKDAKFGVKYLSFKDQYFPYKEIKKDNLKLGKETFLKKN
jgi:hypothetical protein